MNAIVITIGDELLIGQVVDTNSAWLGNRLSELGVHVSERMAVGDDSDAIKEAIHRAIQKADLILLTGGLGPTKDDITKVALAEYFGAEMEFHEPTWARIERLFKRWGRSTTPAHRQQCYMPSNAILLENKMGTAPGMLFHINGKDIVSMPGVPYEMQYIMEHGVVPIIDGKEGKTTIIHHTIRTAGEGESRIAQAIEDISDLLPDYIKLAFLPGLGQVRLRLSGIGENPGVLEKEILSFSNKICARLGDIVYGFGEKTLEEVLGQLCIEKNIRIGTAESCTGGYVSHRITSVPGSSAYYYGSIISYDNSAKVKQLNVSPITLKDHGAVSEETVLEMLQGLLHKMSVDAGISISGIAGPDGGSLEKPVGTIWIACGNKTEQETLLIKSGKDRTKNIEYAGIIAMDLLRKFVMRQ